MSAVRCPGRIEVISVPRAWLRLVVAVVASVDRGLGHDGDELWLCTRGSERGRASWGVARGTRLGWDGAVVATTGRGKCGVVTQGFNTRKTTELKAPRGCGVQLRSPGL